MQRLIHPLLVAASLSATVFCSRGEVAYTADPPRSVDGPGPPENPLDWPQRGRSGSRNHVAGGPAVPLSWNLAKRDRQSRSWSAEESTNIKWIARLGSQTYGSPVVAGGKVFIGTNNGAAYLPRYPATVDLGCLLCFRESDGEFLWQHSSEKLSTGRIHDWPLQGICSSPVVEGDRLWFVTNRGEVRCLDTEGFYDGEDDGPVQNDGVKLLELRVNHSAEAKRMIEAFAGFREGRLSPYLREELERMGVELPSSVSIVAHKAKRRWELKMEDDAPKIDIRFVANGGHLIVSRRFTVEDRHEADLVWSFDMMDRLGVSQHNMANCSPTLWGDTLFICTSNGVDESHAEHPAAHAPSFIALDKNTARVLWTDASPGDNVLHGQWSSPAVGRLAGVPQVIFAGGDGWVYSFRADRWNDGKPEMLWTFDANPKSSRWMLGGSGTRNNVIAMPVIDDGRVYVAVGQDPEHGEGPGHLWCIDPSKRGDVSAEQVIGFDGQPVPRRRIQAAAEWLTIWSGPDKGVTAASLANQFKTVIHEGLRQAGITLPSRYRINTTRRGFEWSVIATIDGLQQQFRATAVRTGKRSENRYLIRIERRLDERIIPNPNSAVIWHFDHSDRNGDGEIEFEEEFHRSMSSPAIKDGLLIAVDYSGLVHCFDAKTGTQYWTHDTFAACWSDPLIVDDKVFVGDEDGDVAIFQLSADPTDLGEATREPLRELSMRDSIYPTPSVANGVLYLATKTQLFAIGETAPSSQD